MVGVANPDQPSFSALPAGIRNSYGKFNVITYATAFWTSSGKGQRRGLFYEYDKIQRIIGSFSNNAMSIRLVLD